MTDKEKSENYYFSLREKKIEFTYENVRECIKQAYLDGLTEGREEMKKEYKENAIPYVFELKDKVKDLEKENAKLSKMLEMAIKDYATKDLANIGWFAIDEGYEEEQKIVISNYKKELEKRVRMKNDR